VTLALPDDPALVGATLCSQALVLPFPGLPRLPNVVSEVVLP